VWKDAVDALDDANKYFDQQDARVFVERCMASIIGILVEQQPSMIGLHERNYVEEYLILAAMIVANDLEIQLGGNEGKSVALETLNLVFNKKKAFYRGTGTFSDMSTSQEFRTQDLRAIESSRATNGFERRSQTLFRKPGRWNFQNLRRYTRSW
jgi:hypothetical protein